MFKYSLSLFHIPSHFTGVHCLKAVLLSQPQRRQKTPETRQRVKTTFWFTPLLQSKKTPLSKFYFLWNADGINVNFSQKYLKKMWKIYWGMEILSREWTQTLCGEQKFILGVYVTNIWGKQYLTSKIFFSEISFVKYFTKKTCKKYTREWKGWQGSGPTQNKHSVASRSVASRLSGILYSFSIQCSEKC